LGVKILKFFNEGSGSGIRDGDSSDPGWKKVGSGINIPDHWDFQSQNRLRREEEERELLGKQIEALTEKQTRIQAERSARAEQAR
jgi:hypothetical protein